MTPREQMLAAAAREREGAAIERERLLHQAPGATWRARHPFLYALVLGLIPVGIALIAVIGALLAD